MVCEPCGGTQPFFIGVVRGKVSLTLSDTEPEAAILNKKKNCVASQ